MSSFHLSEEAARDLDHILEWSQEQFGDAARERYEALLTAGLMDVVTSPERLGSRTRPELGEGVRTWHLSISRGRTGATPVHEPRHFLVYRFNGDVVEIGRVLHDSMDLARHVDSQSWE